MQPSYDEVIVLRFIAPNVAPFDFRWKDELATFREYGAALVRRSVLCEKRL